MATIKITVTNTRTGQVTTEQEFEITMEAALQIIGEMKDKLAQLPADRFRILELINTDTGARIVDISALPEEEPPKMTIALFRRLFCGVGGRNDNND